ncbi:hypothetical protein IJ670_03235, partial [bacterium]|nr:hypothetical protein [bacterium]
DWFMPEFDEDWGVYKEIDPDKLKKTLEMNDYKAFIMTSPTYEGINSDLEKIASVCQSKGVILLVDEAHGSLNVFSGRFKSAIEAGCDVSVNSLHKTAGALNQTALLNVSNNSRLEGSIFQKAKNIFHTTSPSYPLLYNIEECLAFLNSKKGKQKIEKLYSDIKKMQDNLKKYGFEFYNEFNHDMSKILVRHKNISSTWLSDVLFDEFNIEDEMSCENFCLYMTGIGTDNKKLKKLEKALIKVLGKKDKKEKTNTENIAQPHPLVKIQPFLTFNLNYVYVNKSDAVGKISNSLICPYPPGIGILYPGEVIQEWHLDYLEEDVEVVK